jgi:hypothetical protein
MLRLKKISVLSIFFLLVLFSCKKDRELTTPSDFLSKDDSDSKIRREYKTWIVQEASIIREGLPTLVYKKGQPIQGNFDPSKITFVFSSNNTYDSTDEKGNPERGQWIIDETGKTLRLITANSSDSFDIVQLNRTNFDFKNDETVEDKVATVTIKMIPNL